MGVSRDLRLWVRCLQWAWRIIAAACVLLAGFATLMIIADETDHEDDWDGLGTFFGLIGAGFSVVLFLLTGVVLAVLRVGWRRFQTDGAVGILRGAAVVTILVAGGWLYIAIGLTMRGSSPGVKIATVSPSPLAIWLASMVLVKSRTGSGSTQVLQSLAD